MNEISIVVCFEPDEQRGLAQGVHRVPADMRYAAPGSLGETRRATRNDAEALSLTLIRGFEQQLHAETYAEHRLAQGGEQLMQMSAAQPHHGVGGGAHTWEDDVR